MEQDLIDIIVTTYNSKEKFLRKQIESLINQTYKNIKIHISDDFSTDRNVVDILKEYEKKDNRIQLYLQEKNLGYNKNFEYLLKQTQAEYIMFCDHDDIWYKNKVAESIKKIKQSNVDLVYCNCKQIDENDNILKENYFKFKNVPIIKGKSKLAISRCIGIGCSQIITKDVKNKMIPFKQNVMAHDWLAAFIANEGKGIDYIYEPLFNYRLHNNNVFGGRNLSQNLKRWKEKEGNSYTSYLKYREEVIDTAYLSGAKMCLEYEENEGNKENKKFIENIIKYYENLKKSKYINFKLITYFKALSGKNLLKKIIKELIIFHFPIVGYVIFKIK